MKFPSSMHSFWVKSIIQYCQTLAKSYKRLTSVQYSDWEVCDMWDTFLVVVVVISHHMHTHSSSRGVKSLFSHKNEWKWSLISCMYANAKKSKEEARFLSLSLPPNWRWLLFTSGDRQEREGKYLLAHTKIHNHHLCDDNTGREHIKILPWCFVRKLPLVPYRTCHLSFVKTDSPVAN